MTPGIPGAGIGGLFYVCSSLVLAMRHAWRRVHRRTDAAASHDVLQLFLVALGIGLGVWIVGWLVGFFVSTDLQVSSQFATTTFGDRAEVRNIIRIAALVVGVATLALVLLSVELMRLWLRGPRRSRSAAYARGCAPE